MRGTLFKLYDAGRRLDREARVGTGDFNFTKAENTASRLIEQTAVFYPEATRNQCIRLAQAQVIAVAGFGLHVVGFEQSKVGRNRIAEVRQEWWFVPLGHEENAH